MRIFVPKSRRRKRPPLSPKERRRAAKYATLSRSLNSTGFQPTAHY